jgi:hypothetical protein
MSKLKFRFRGFTSLLMFFSFLISLVSGIVLYFPPQGKIAHWTHWTFWGLDKELWGALHINSSLIFFIIALLHLYYNWKVILRYVKKRAVMAFNLKYEFFVAALLSVFIIIATLFNIEPFKTIIDWNEDIKNYWATQAEAQPPVPHAEDLTVTQFCEQFNIPVKSFQQKLNQKGWTFTNDHDTIKDIARCNNVSPAEIYNILQKSGSSNRKYGQGQMGWGRKSLRDACNELNQDVETALQSLAAHGIRASGNDNIKTLADQNNLRPIEIANIIRGSDVVK